MYADDKLNLMLDKRDTSFEDHLSYFCLVFVMLSFLFIAAL